MPLQKYWIIALFCFICQVQLTSAEPLAEHEEVLNDKANTPLLSEDLVQQLEKRLPQNKFTQWLLNFIFISPQATQKNLIIAPYLPYQVKIISLTQLDRQGVLRAKASGSKKPASIIFSTRKDGGILDQLSFVPGGIIVPQQITANQERCNEYAHSKEEQIKVQQREDSRDSVNVHTTTKDRWSIGPGLDLDKPSLSITHNNLFGWGHLLQLQFLYDQKIGYGIKYSAPNIKQTEVTGELEYLNTRRKSIKNLCIFRNFTNQTDYAGKVEAGKTDNEKWRILDGSTIPQSTSFSFHHQCVWLGTAFNIHPSDDRHQGRLFLTAKVAHQHFLKRPTVTKIINRYFHHHVFGAGSVGFSNKRDYKDQLVYGVGSIENIPYGSKVNLIGGYQVGEFINRPYLRLDIARGGRIQQLGHLYGAVNVGGFWHEKAIEQGIVQLQLNYFTPLLDVGTKWIRQFIRLDYLAGYNMFTGELISTNTKKVPKSFGDPFLGGTQRMHLGLETVLSTPRRFAGCQVAALVFVDTVRLQNAQGKSQQGSFCKALGIGFRCAHPRFFFDTLQVKVYYSPLTQNMNFTISTGVASSSDNLDIDEPEIIPFQEY